MGVIEKVKGLKIKVFLKIRTACNMLGLSYNELRNGINQGRYPFIKKGHAYMVDPEMILEELRKEAENNKLKILDT